jgi:hypothetical protein
MAKLTARFERDRTLVGGIYLYRDSGILEVFYSALGKAAMDDAANNGNAGALPTFPYGDTPTGGYDILSIAPTGPGTAYPDIRKYGTAGVIKLDLVSGEAATAKQNGRTGLLVHGGDPGSTSLLRLTNGCIRMMNSDLADLISHINSLKDDTGEDTTRLDVEEIGAPNNGGCDSNGACGEGDPPPGF